jgi:CRISPR-associated exonuclease Cas4
MACLGVLAALGWPLHRRSHRTRGGLPVELRGARLIHEEQLFRSVGLVSITARVDRVYRKASGELVLLELKTRRASRAYLSDVIELSAQRVAVMTQTGEPVAGHAYVLTQAPEGRTTAWLRVELMTPRDVTALALRRQALLAGEITARCVRSPGICRTCAFQRECDSSDTSSHGDLKPSRPGAF